MYRDIEDTRAPKEGKSCPICDGELEPTGTGVHCIECEWAWDDGNYDAEDD